MFQEGGEGLKKRSGRKNYEDFNGKL